MKSEYEQAKECLELMEQIGDAVPTGTPVYSVMFAALTLAVFSSKELGQDKIYAQEMLVRIWDSTPHP